MRILHTADWHLGDHLGYIDRTNDQFGAVERIMEYCDAYEVDVLVVAGDVIEDYRSEALTGLVRRLARILMSRLERGMRAVFISGNHDREHLFLLLQTVQSLSSPEMVRRIHFTSRPCTLRLPDPSGDYDVQFVLAPYPTAHDYLPANGGKRVLTGAERRHVLAHAFADKLALAQEELDPRLPTVLVAHATVRGAETSTRFRLSEAEDIVVEAQDMPTWAYVALGHIHKPQAVAGRPSVRYAGSIDRLDGGERDDDKSCVLVEIDRAGLVGQPQLLPLPATPIYTVRIDGDTNLDTLAERYPDHPRALVGLQVAYRPGVDNPHALVTRAKAIFPRNYKLDVYAVTGPGGSGNDLTIDNARDLGSTVRAYVEQRLGDIEPEVCERVLRLAAQIVEEVRDATPAH